MPTQSLPSNPSIENLRKQAKSLLKGVRAGDANALTRVREFHPRSTQALQNFRLNDAQLVIARSYEFAGWSKLKEYVEMLDRHSFMPPHPKSVIDSEPVTDQFIRLACLDYLADHTSRREKARELLAQHPSIARENIYTAAAVGDVTTVRALLRQNPKLATLRGGPHKWEPLLYATYSRLDSESPGHSTLEVARLLLKHGADPNSGFLWNGHYVFTALTGAFGEGEAGPVHQSEHQYCYELARLLLETGADPNDSQTLYNRMFTGGTRHLELLFEFGLGKGGDGVWFKRLGDRLGTPVEMLQQQMGWAAKYNQLERMRLLIAHGVDVDGRDIRLERTAYELALLNGHREIAELLLQHGATPTLLSNLDAFAAACLTGDEQSARSLLTSDPSLLQQLGTQRVELLQLAAERDNRYAMRLMNRLGFDLNEVSRTTALHNAAMAGHLEMVKLLIELGADHSIHDTEFDGTPRGWAEYSGNTEVADYLKSLEASEQRTES
ncbi:MAG TPA: ankyrin repeat domain-containing protein [Pyrinomonadaceae bacterium]